MLGNGRVAVVQAHAVDGAAAASHPWARQPKPRTRMGWLGPLLLSLLAGSCSFSIDADRAQCSINRDCEDRGGAFAGSICMEGVCQSPCDGGWCERDPNPSALTDACVGARCTRADASRDAARDAARDASNAPPSDLPDAESDLPDAEVETPAPDAGHDEAQCMWSGDCQSLAADALCVDGVCWRPQAMNGCGVDMDCAALGPEYVDGLCLGGACRPNPRWRCEPPKPPDASEQLTLRILVRDSLSLLPISKVRAVACQKLDVECIEPVTEAVTGDDGILTLNVRHDFAGYLRLGHARFYPAMYFLPSVLPQDGQLQPAPLLGNGLIDGLALSIGSTLDPKRGHMMLISEDCLGAALPGVTFESPQEDKATIQFYVRDLLPSTAATETGDIGNGGYVNFPAGTAVIEVTAKDPALKLTTVSVLVRPQVITIAYIRPDLR